MCGFSSWFERTSILSLQDQPSVVAGGRPSFLNPSLFWGVVPSHWKHSIVIPVLKRGDSSVPYNYCPISLASFFFKLLERLILSRISPHISPQLDESQGVFRWSADLLVGPLVSLLSSRPSSHIFVAFIEGRRNIGSLVRCWYSASHVEIDVPLPVYAVPSASGILSLALLDGLWHRPRSGLLPSSLQPLGQRPHCCCAACSTGCATVLFTRTFSWAALR